MKLRKLKIKDAKMMLEWMHDDFIVHDLLADFASKSINDCIMFIKCSQSAKTDINLAIITDDDEYMGTVSLKHIDKSLKEAEFAITIRRVALGKGYSEFAMKEVIKIAFKKLKLKKIYWCVSENNHRAIRFYEKQGYKEYKPNEEKKFDRYQALKMLRWYSIDNNTNGFSG